MLYTLLVKSTFFCSDSFRCSPKAVRLDNNFPHTPDRSSTLPTPRSRSFREDVFLICYDLYDLANGAGWEPYSPHDLIDRTCCRDTALPLTSAREELDYLDHDISVHDLPEVRIVQISFRVSCPVVQSSSSEGEASGNSQNFLGATPTGARVRIFVSSYYCHASFVVIVHLPPVLKALLISLTRRPSRTRG